MSPRMLCLALPLLLAAVSATAEPLKTPFLLRDAKDIKQRDVECRPIPAPVTRLALSSKYGDDGPERDDIDQAAEEAFETAFKPVGAWLSAVVRHANRFTEKGRSGDADCARAALLEWINAGALSDLASHTDVFKLSTTLSGLTAAYLQIRPAVPDKDRATIEAWFVNRAVAIRDHVETEAGPRSRANNHRYWSGAAVALAGLAADRTDLVEWGFGSYELGVCSADRDGALPLEVARGKRARDYHLYALAPLVVLAEIGTANGRQSYAICRNALARIIDFSLQSIINPEAIEKLAAQPQFAFADGKDLPSAKNLVFLEAYLKRFPEALKQHKLIERALPGLRPFRMTELGGSMTLLVLGPPKAPDTGVETEMQSGTE